MKRRFEECMKRRQNRMKMRERTVIKKVRGWRMREEKDEKLGKVEGRESRRLKGK